MRLATLTDLAHVLRVSRKTMQNYAQGVTRHGFPEPVITSGRRKWDRDAVLAWHIDAESKRVGGPKALTGDDEIRKALRERTDIDPETGCHMWTGPTTSSGYPRIHVEGENLSARQESFRLAYGRPAPVQPRMTCRRRRCIRPDHIAQPKT